MNKIKTNNKLKKIKYFFTSKNGKIISIILTVILIVFLGGIIVNSVKNYRGFLAGSQFELKNDDTLTVVKIKQTDIKDFILPKTYRGKIISEIGGDAFINNNFVSVTIPSTVTKIADRLFANNNDIKKVIFEADSKIEVLPKDTFYKCEHLTEVVLPDNLKKINDSAFDGCRNLKNINLPQSLLSIGDSAFDGCRNLKNVNLPQSLLSIGDSAFYSCENLQIINVEKGSSLKEIGYQAFSKNNKLLDFYISNSVSVIGAGAFEATVIIYYEGKQLNDSWGNLWHDGIDSLNNKQIEFNISECGSYNNELRYFIKNGEVTICNILVDVNNLSYNLIIPEQINGNDVIEIKNNDTRGYSISRIKNIFLPMTLTTISNSAFSNCDNLKYLHIPKSVTKADSNMGINSPSNVVIFCQTANKPSGFEQNWNANCPVVYDYNNIEKNEDFEYTITNGKIKITRYIGNLKNITIPNTIGEKNVNAIGKFAFCGDDLNVVFIPNGVDTIEDSAFYCKVGESRKLLYFEAAQKNATWNFEKIYGGGKFYGLETYNVKEYGVVEYGGGKPGLDFFNYVLTNNSQLIITAYTAADFLISSITEREIPAEINGIKVSAIGKWAFYRLDSLQKIIISKDITTNSEWIYECPNFKGAVIK